MEPVDSDEVVRLAEHIPVITQPCGALCGRCSRVAASAQKSSHKIVEVRR